MTTVPQLSPDSAAAALARAAQAWQAGAWSEVVALLTPWADAHQPLPDALLLAAMAHLRQGQTEQALARQRQLVQLQPASAAAWINLASTQAAIGLTEEALASLDQALTLDPMQPAAHFNRGNVLMQRGDAAAACDSYRRAAELAPDRADPRCNLAMALNALWRQDDALAIMRDPHCGSFAVVGLVSLLGIKALALIELAFISPLVAASALLAAHPLSRLAALQISDHLPYARAGSVSRASALVAPGHGQRAVALLAGLLPLLLLPWDQMLLLPVVAVLAVAWAARLFRQRLGGYTGDCLGATQQAVETLCYLTLTASWNFI